MFRAAAAADSQTPFQMKFPFVIGRGSPDCDDVRQEEEVAGCIPRGFMDAECLSLL